MIHAAHWLLWFLIDNGIGQNITASAILGVPAFVHIHKKLERHHRAHLEQLNQLRHR